MLKKTLTILILATINVSAMDLFKAEYKVFKDGKEIGTSSIELTKEEPFYKIIDKTNGTHGMASLLGFKRIEETLFTNSGNQFHPDFYKMKQKVAFNKRQSDYQVDNETQMVYGKHKGDDWQIKTPSSFLTPNLVSLKLFQDICSGKTDNLNYKVLKRGEVVDYKFKITSKKDNIIEVDKIHSKPSRVTKTWLDNSQHCLPVRTYHKEGDDDALETKIKNVTFY